MQLERRQPMAADVEAFECIALRHADQTAVEGVGPGVIAASDALAAVALRPFQKPRRAMPADIVKGAHRAIITAHDNDRLTQKIEAVIVPGAGHIAHMADDLPAVAENRFLLELEEVAIMIDPTRQTEGRRVGLSGHGRIHGIKPADFTHDTPQW
jgi:hypothetical protein